VPEWTAEPFHLPGHQLEFEDSFDFCRVLCFATNYKDLSPKWILVDSSESERNPSLKLTLPGKKRALSLATKIEEEGQSKIDKTLSHS
jgi:hypothetical protein